MKKSYYFLFALLTCYWQASMGQVQNGAFESWSGNTPASWTTIDSGIGVSNSSSIVRNGSYSMRVSVNTTTQSSTDLRQTISVTPGQSYTFSVWVYQSDNESRARLYVDGYRNYSNPSLTNTWQQISYTYTPSSSSIQVGVRFYDVSGFDGSSVIYLDDFEPNNGNSGGGGSGCNDTDIGFTLVTDNYGSETSWVLRNSNGSTIDSGSGYSSNSTYSETLCLPDGTYTFTINDSYGDGICCSVGNGSYRFTNDNTILISGGNFGSSESKTFTVGSSGGGAGGSGYYADANGKNGYTLKTALYNIINNHNTRGYSALWGFYSSNELDLYYENDGTILSMYSENPNGNDAYSFTKVSDQCGSYSGEGSCYNREHSFPNSWFGGSVEPMYSDVHAVFPADGYVNGIRGNYPFGEVTSATYISSNGSRRGSGSSSFGYTGTVFEPIDEFKGDFARAYFYMATRYENVIAGWENNSSAGDIVLDGSDDRVFETWMLNTLLQWHAQDPVSQKEIDRNEAAYSYQGNRNPYIDHPEYVGLVWGNAFARVAVEKVVSEQSSPTLSAHYANNELHVKGDRLSSLKITVLDMTGRTVFSSLTQNNNEKEAKFPVALKSDKVYIIALSTDTESVKLKLMVE